MERIQDRGTILYLSLRLKSKVCFLGDVEVLATTIELTSVVPCCVASFVAGPVEHSDGLYMVLEMPVDIGTRAATVEEIMRGNFQFGWPTTDALVLQVESHDMASINWNTLVVNVDCDRMQEMMCRLHLTTLHRCFYGRNLAHVLPTVRSGLESSLVHLPLYAELMQIYPLTQVRSGDVCAHWNTFEPQTQVAHMSRLGNEAAS